MLSGVTSSRPSQWHWRALNEVSGATCTKPQGDRGPPVPRPRTTLYGARRRVWPGIPSSSRCTKKNSGGRGLTGFTRSGRRNGTSGTPWSRSSTARRSCRRLMFLCPAGGGVPAPGLADPRTGYRSAQDLVYTPSSSQAPCALRGADGRTVGGSTDDYLLFFVTWDYGAERGHSSSSWSWRSCRYQKSSRFPRTEFNSV